MSLWGEIFTWWRGQTIGTRLATWRYGSFVGEDADGNRFYQRDGGKRRWVIYNGLAEASRISPEWHGWLHHTFDAPPTESPLPQQAWQKPHQENPTGSDAAYHPGGSLLQSQPTPVRGYQAWSPE